MNRGRLAGFLADSARFDAVLNTKAGTLDLPAVSFTTEWREGAPEGHPPPTAWRSFPTPRFERGERLSTTDDRQMSATDPPERAR